jgi:hypothetical protein
MNRHLWGSAFLTGLEEGTLSEWLYEVLSPHAGFLIGQPERVPPIVLRPAALPHRRHGRAGQ